MAIFVPGGVAAGGYVSGKVGGNVFSRNRFGAYIRARVVPVNPNTVFQQDVRGRFGTLTNRWNNVLTAAQRTAWTVYAQTVPVTNRLGLGINLTGLNWYLASNALRSQAGFIFIDTAPTVFTLGTYTVPVLTATAAGGFSIAFTNTDAWANEIGGAMCFFQGQPVSSTINFFKGPFRFLGTVNGAVVPPASPVVFLPAALRFPIALGQ